MLLRQFIQLRKFSTSPALLRPSLTAEYKSKQLWDGRFNCKLLSSDPELIKSINTKIIMGSELNNLETDIYINIAAPRADDIAHLQETAGLLKKFRRTVYAHTLLPSSAHATCRLFLDSQKPNSLVTLLENRVEFGIFPDAFSLNLLFDTALEREDYALSSRIAALVMLQEEFGMNEISDKFALYSVIKYIESKTDFENWNTLTQQQDPIFAGEDQLQTEFPTEKTDTGQSDTKAEAEEAEEEGEDEDDAEYIRIPFLRNPYFDNHFDLKNPRLICGKTLSMQGYHLSQSSDNDLAKKCMLLGEILQGKWSDAKNLLNDCSRSNIMLGQIGEVMQFYIENLHGVDGPDGDLNNSLRDGLAKLIGDNAKLSEAVEKSCINFGDIEKHDIEQLKANLVEWSNLRIECKEARIRNEERRRLIAEIKAKKEEIRLQEQYLYFYDELKKKNLTRIEYD